MKKTQKVLCLLIATLLSVLLALSGCGSSGNSTESSSAEITTTQAETTAAQTETTAPELKPYTLQYYFPGFGPQRFTDAAEVETAMNAILTQKINAKVKLNSFDWNSYDQKMKMMIASGEQFDVCFTTNWINNYSQNAAKGAFVDMLPLLDKDAPGLTDQLPAFMIDGSKVGGKLWAFPVIKETAGSIGFLYLQDITKKLNLDVSGIKSWADWEPIFSAVKKANPKMDCVGFQKTDNYVATVGYEFFVDNSVPAVVPYEDNGLKVVNALEQQNVKDYFKLMRKWYQMGFFNKDAAVINDRTNDMKSGKIFLTASIYLKPDTDVEQRSQFGQDIAQLSISAPYAATANCTGSMNAISKTSQDPDRSMMFINLMSTDKDLVNLINFGIEGKHYTKKDADTIEFPAGKTSDTIGYAPTTQWMFFNYLLDFTKPGDMPGKGEAYKKFNDSAKASQTIGFAFNQEPVKTEIASCINVWNEYLPGLMSGTSDPDVNLPKAIEKFKSVGLDKVLAEAQSQLDAWKAGK